MFHVWFLTTVKNGHPSLTSFPVSTETAACVEAYEFINEHYGKYLVSEEDMTKVSKNLIVWEKDCFRATLIRA